MAVPFPGGGEDVALGGWQVGIWVCRNPESWLHISPEGLCELGQTTRKKGGTWARIRRPWGKVPGDELPASNPRQEDRKGGPGELLPASQTPPGEVAARLPLAREPRDLVRPWGKVREKTGFKNSPDASLATWTRREARPQGSRLPL